MQEFISIPSYYYPESSVSSYAFVVSEKFPLGYSDDPMDLADASLVALAEQHRIKKIFTLDRRDFSRYHPKHCARFEIVP